MCNICSLTLENAKREIGGMGWLRPLGPIQDLVGEDGSLTGVQDDMSKDICYPYYIVPDRKPLFFENLTTPSRSKAVCS